MIGAGKHDLISQQPYVFSGRHGEDCVVVAFRRK